MTFTNFEKLLQVNDPQIDIMKFLGLYGIKSTTDLTGFNRSFTGKSISGAMENFIHAMNELRLDELRETQSQALRRLMIIAIILNNSDLKQEQLQKYLSLLEQAVQYTLQLGKKSLQPLGVHKILHNPYQDLIQSIHHNQKDELKAIEEQLIQLKNGIEAIQSHIDVISTIQQIANTTDSSDSKISQIDALSKKYEKVISKNESLRKQVSQSKEILRHAKAPTQEANAEKATKQAQAGAPRPNPQNVINYAEIISENKKAADKKRVQYNSLFKKYKQMSFSIGGVFEVLSTFEEPKEPNIASNRYALFYHNASKAFENKFHPTPFYMSGE